METPAPDSSGPALPARPPRSSRPLVLFLALVIGAALLLVGRALLNAWSVQVPGRPSAATRSQGIPQERGVLFIGNSLTYFNDLPATIRYLAQGAGEAKPFDYGVETVSGAAQARIAEGVWTAVVLQDLSTMPTQSPETMERFIRLFHGCIKQQGPETVLFMTWAWRSEPQDQVLITAAYDGMGKELGLRVAPVGRAWEYVLERHPEIELFVDNRHPSGAGTYLAAAVFFGFFYNKSPRGLPLQVPWLDLAPGHARVLQEAAAKTLEPSSLPQAQTQP
jgi:hypothetical protein